MAARTRIIGQRSITVLLVAATVGASSPTGHSAATAVSLIVDATAPVHVTSSPSGIDCPDVCSATFEAGTHISLVASGASAVGWTGACAGTSGATCELLLTADAEVGAAPAAPPPAPPPPPPPPPSRPTPPPPFRPKRVRRHQPAPVDKPHPARTPPSVRPVQPSPPAPSPAPARSPVRKPVARPGSTVPVTHPRRAQNPGETVDAEIQSLRRANIAFTVPSDLRVGTSVPIQLRLSPTESISKLTGQLDAPGRREGATIRYSRKMEAHLTGIDFRIRAVDPETQLVSESQGAAWEWEIEPVTTGSLRLHLTLTAHVPGGDRTIRTYDRVLVVRVTFFHRLSSFAGSNWPWLWTAILVPSVGFLIRRRRQHSGNP